MWYLLNAFSIKMLAEGCFWRDPEPLSVALARDSGEGVPCEFPFASLDIEEVPLEVARETSRKRDLTSAVGHDSTAKVLSARLGVDVQRRRVDVAMKPGDCALLCQVDLPRLAEGEVLTDEQLQGVKVRFFRIYIYA